MIQLSVIIAAAGHSSRMGGGNKILTPLLGKPALCWSVELFAHTPQVKEIIIAAKEDCVEHIRSLTTAYGAKIKVVRGGTSRAASVQLALEQVNAASSHIAVHDAARPLLSPADWQALLAAAENGPGGVILAAPARDSIRSHNGQYLEQALDRETLLLAQTPQLFPAALLRHAYRSQPQLVQTATDEAELVCALGGKVRFVFSRDANFKLTVPEDLIQAEAVLRRRTTPIAAVSEAPTAAIPAINEGNTSSPATATASSATASPEQPLARANSQPAQPTATRCGWGWDIHRLSSGRRLILGGVEIPHSQGLLGHSDADVLLHALIDAMLGAAALGDIGQHFPDNDPAYKDISSLLLLQQTQQLLSQAGWRLINIDATVIAQQPRLAPHIAAIRDQIAATLGLEPTAVSVKAKTAEGLGVIGHQQAIAATAMATICRIND